MNIQKEKEQLIKAYNVLECISEAGRRICEKEITLCFYRKVSRNTSMWVYNELEQAEKTISTHKSAIKKLWGYYQNTIIALEKEMNVNIK